MNVYVIEVYCLLDGKLDASEIQPELKFCPKKNGMVTLVDAKLQTFEISDTSVSDTSGALEQFVLKKLKANYETTDNYKEYDNQVINLHNQPFVRYQNDKVIMPNNLSSKPITEWPPLGLDVSKIDDDTKTGSVYLTLFAFENKNIFNQQIIDIIEKRYSIGNNNKHYKHYVYHKIPNRDKSDTLDVLHIGDLNNFMSKVVFEIVKELDIAPYGEICSLITAMSDDLNIGIDSNIILSRLFDKL